MATKNQSGISIKIELFVPTGTSIEEAYTALSMVRDAAETGDYAGVLAKGQIDHISIKQVNRRVEVVEVAEATEEAQEMPLSQRKAKAAA